MRMSKWVNMKVICIITILSEIKSFGARTETEMWTAAQGTGCFDVLHNKIVCAKQSSPKHTRTVVLSLCIYAHDKTVCYNMIA